MRDTPWGLGTKMSGLKEWKRLHSLVGQELYQIQFDSKTEEGALNEDLYK